MSKTSITPCVRLMVATSTMPRCGQISVNRARLSRRMPTPSIVVTASSSSSSRSRNLGFIVKLKPYIQRSDGSAKGDWDVGITLDIMDAADHVDEVVLASGDGDFDMLLDRIISKHGVQAVAYGVPGLTANSLIRAASRYVPIEGALLLKN